MERYDYYEAVKADVIDYINNEIDFSDYTDREELETALNDELWTVDSVTGNGSGSYTFSRYEAEEHLAHNLDLLAEALEEYGCEDYKKYLDDPEAADVTIRCYLLGQCIGAALDELEIDDDTFTTDDEEDYDEEEA